MEHFAKKFTDFTSFPLCLFTKIYKTKVEASSAGDLSHNSLILNDLRAPFEKKNPTKSTPFSIILAS